MVITVKLFAFLAKHLPPGAERNVAKLNLAEGTTVSQVIDELHVPLEHCHLVLVDGVYVPLEERDTRVLPDGGTLAIWPMVAGG